MDEHKAFIIGLIVVIGFFSNLALLSLLTSEVVLIPGLGEISLLNAAILIILGIVGAIVIVMVYKIFDGLKLL